MDAVTTMIKGRHPKLGVTYSSVSTNDDSSEVIAALGVSNAAGLASQLLLSLPTSRCCAISIANASKSRLSNPHVYLFSGAVKSPPFVIDHSSTGLMGSYKKPLTARGCAGVLTYDMEAWPPLQLQVMWSVPIDFNLFDSWVNVCVGERTASSTLYQDMYHSRHGEVIRARDTCRIFKLTPNVRAEVVMSDHGRCTLVVRLFKDT